MAERLRLPLLQPERVTEGLRLAVAQPLTLTVGEVDSRKAVAEGRGLEVTVPAAVAAIPVGRGELEELCTGLPL